MEIYVDTADVNEVKRAMRMRILDGVTTNPSLIARQGRDFRTTIEEMASIVEGKVWCEVLSTEADSMVAEAQSMKDWTRETVIKLPMGVEGIRAMGILSGEGLQVNVTLVYSAAQALLAAKAGATYVSPYVGRADDTGISGVRFVQQIKDMFRAQGFGTKVIAASVRSPQQVVELAAGGVDAVTMPYNVLDKMAHHPMTERDLNQFLEDWSAAGM